MKKLVRIAEYDKISHKLISKLVNSYQTNRFSSENNVFEP